MGKTAMPIIWFFTKISSVASERLNTPVLNIVVHLEFHSNLLYIFILTLTYKYNKIYNVSNKCCKNMIHEVENWKPFIIRRYYEKY